MRSYARNTLLALALAATPLATAHAAPFDGAETAGLGCRSVFLAKSGSGATATHTGVIDGGPWVVADLIQNNSGILGVDSKPAPGTNVTITCTIHPGTDTASPVVTVWSAFPGTGVAYLTPSAFSFFSGNSAFVTCTRVDWIDNRGYNNYRLTCDPAQSG
jgi:hypothetical protein